MRFIITFTALIGLSSLAIAADIDSEADQDAVDYYRDHAAQLKGKDLYDFESIGEAIALRKGYRGGQSTAYSVEFGTALESLLNNPGEAQTTSQADTFDPHARRSRTDSTRTPAQRKALKSQELEWIRATNKIPLDQEIESTNAVAGEKVAQTHRSTHGPRQIPLAGYFVGQMNQAPESAVSGPLAGHLRMLSVERK